VDTEAFKNPVTVGAQEKASKLTYKNKQTAKTTEKEGKVGARETSPETWS
jgi:hypothetical protein